MGAINDRAHSKWHIDDLISAAFAMKMRFWLLWMSALSLCFASLGAQAQMKSVTIFGYQQDEAMLETVEGVRDTLRAAGFREGRNLKLRIAEAQGTPERAQQVALELVRGLPDVLITVSLPATLAVMTQTSRIPIVFTAVADPEEEGLVVTKGPSGTNVTGVLETISLQKRIGLIKQVAGKARRIGVIYNPMDRQSLEQVRAFQEQLSGAGLIAIEVTVFRPNEVGAAARSLVEKIDVFQTFDDTLVAQAYTSIVQVANDAKVPLFGWGTKDVTAGAVAALDLTERDMGAASGRVALRILRGTKPGAIAVEAIPNPPAYVNMKAASLQSVQFSAPFLKSASVLVQ